MEDFTVVLILVDNESLINVIFKKTFDGLQVEAGRVIASDGPLFGFFGEDVEGGEDLLKQDGKVVWELEKSLLSPMSSENGKKTRSRSPVSPDNGIELVAGKWSVQEHIMDLVETFATLRKFKMRLNPVKCVFGAGRGSSWGHLLTPKGVEPNLDKVKTILEMALPKSTKEVQRLIERLKFEWAKKCEESFEKFKQELTHAPLLQGLKEEEDLLLYLGVGVEAGIAILRSPTIIARLRHEDNRTAPPRRSPHASAAKGKESKYDSSPFLIF
ncbi:hypothetical protein KSP39_PZI000937 [Platanthera zijinensis]|uniref:Uncharacterized protein n=1 Tax=Platanthera zijinensis TaxID=2320716 RepID=A0AAP0C177_9ASPA